jgi:dihydroflavonol-4-reductase
VVRRLAQTDHDLRCLARRTSDVALLRELGVEIVFGDVTNKASLVAAMQGCHWAINLANVYDFWVPDPSVLTEVNVVGTQNLMEAALETGVSKVVHVSSAVVYGKPHDYPFMEGSSPGPELFSEYARTKREGERLAWKLHGEKGLPLVVLYPGGVLGAGDTKATMRLVEDLVRRRVPATTFPDSMVVLIYVRDVVEAIVCAAEKEGNSGERYLLGKEPIALGDFCRTVCDLAGVRMPSLVLPGWMVMLLAHGLTAFSRITRQPPWLGLSLDQMRTFSQGYVCDGSKAERELGIVYTPIRVALAEEVAAVRERLN